MAFAFLSQNLQYENFQNISVAMKESYVHPQLFLHSCEEHRAPTSLVLLAFLSDGSSVKAKGTEELNWEYVKNWSQTLEERMSHDHQCFKEN